MDRYLIDPGRTFGFTMWNVMAPPTVPFWLVMVVAAVSRRFSRPGVDLDVGERVRRVVGLRSRAASGLRRSELLALEVRLLALDGAGPLVRVRQRARWNKGGGQVLGPLKSRHARRDLPITLELADRLRPLVKDRSADALVFASPETGDPMTRTTCSCA